jgi:outer membrane protein, heavy metal efflux system
MRSAVLSVLLALYSVGSSAQTATPVDERNREGPFNSPQALGLEANLGGVGTTAPLDQATRGPIVWTGADDLIRRALQGNADLAAARLDLDRARARRQQAGLRPNPTLNVAQASGRLAGSEDEREFSASVAFPIELGGKRGYRIDAAEADLAATQADVAERERRLAQQVLSAYIDVLAAARELQITSGLKELDDQTVRVVRSRVEQGDAPPLELNLLLTETARLDSERTLAQGRLDAALSALRVLVGLGPAEPLLVGDARAALAARPAASSGLEASITAALEARPDLRLARLNESAAEAGLRLSCAERTPDLEVSGAFSMSRNYLNPDGTLPILDRDRAVTLGVSLPLPLFNRNQGTIADAQVAIRQARLRRVFMEQVVRSEVTRAYQRLIAAQSASDIFDGSVTNQSADNLRVVRAAYQLGEFRVTEVIMQQRQLLEAEREQAGALVERWRAAADLAASMAITVGSQP